MIKIYKDNGEGEYEETDVFVAHKFSTLTKMEVEPESEADEEEGEMSEEMSAKLTALDKRLSDLMIALESLEKRLDKADIAKAVTAQTEQATALRSSKSVDAAAFYAQVVERVARGL